MFTQSAESEVHPQLPDAGRAYAIDAPAHVKQISPNSRLMASAKHGWRPFKPGSP
jgi:hypothetical protein